MNCLQLNQEARARHKQKLLAKKSVTCYRLKDLDRCTLNNDWNHTLAWLRTLDQDE